MAKFGDWSAIQEAKDIMERYLNNLPEMFEGFDPDKIHFILTKKKNSKEPIKVHAVGYPQYIFMSPYVVEVFEKWWKDMDEKRKNLCVWKAMCAIPNDGFDDSARNYGRKLQPEIKMYMREFAACGGVPNWLENPLAKDPMKRSKDEIAEDVPNVELGSAQRIPVSADDLADAGSVAAVA